MAQAGDWLHLIFCQLNLLEDSEYGQRVLECCGYRYAEQVMMCQQCAGECKMVRPTIQEQGEMWDGRKKQNGKKAKPHNVQACDSCGKLTCSRAFKCLHCGTKCLALGHQLTKAEERKRTFQQTGIEEGRYTWGAQGGLTALGPGWKKRNRGESDAADTEGTSNGKEAKDEDALAPEATSLKDLKCAAPDSGIGDNSGKQAIPWQLKDRCCVRCLCM